MFSAAKGEGAFWDGARAQASAVTKKSEALLCCNGLGYMNRYPFAVDLVLMTLASLSESSRLDEETREELCMVRRNVELEARLIDDLLDLTRITAGKLQLTSGHVELQGASNAFVADLCESKGALRCE